MSGTHSTRHVSWLICLALLAGALPARALDLSLFAPPPQPALAVTIPEAIAQGHGRFVLGVSSTVATSLMHQSTPCDGSLPADSGCREMPSSAELRVPWSGQGALLAGVTLYDYLALGLVVPMALTRYALDGQDARTQGGRGDLGVHLAGGLWTSTSMRMGWQLSATLPTHTRNTFAGEDFVTLTPGIVISQELDRVTVALQLGYHLRKRQLSYGVERDDELIVKVGARYSLLPSVAVVAELRAYLGVGGRSFEPPESPAENDLGLRVGHLDFGELDIGVGSAAWPGDRGLGAPGFRAFLSLRRALFGSTCQYGPEDPDGFRDNDACADPDNDRDRIPDRADACPNDAEDRDGFADLDGCPDLDNDADGLADARDLCPDHSEDSDGFQDADGCPEPDNDLDQVADGSDRCRLDPEDRDGFEDGDGCPEPGPEHPVVTRSGSRLLMSDRVYFEDESDTLRAISTPLLTALASTFKALAGKPRLRVEGYSDDSGDPQHNLDLSYRRARAVVEYLKQQGIEAERLEYVGKGSADPLAPNDSPEGRALNRRVEFLLLER